MEIKKCKIDINKIPKEDREIIVRRFLACVKDYFKKPGVEEEYKLWLAQRDKNFV